MLGKEMSEGDVLTALTGLISPDKPGNQPPRIGPMIVFKILKRRTGLIRVALYPVGTKINKVVKNSFEDLEGRTIKIIEEVPQNLEIWEIPVNWEVKIGKELEEKKAA
jgi:hypothetical protein